MYFKSAVHKNNILLFLNCKNEINQTFIKHIKHKCKIKILIKTK